MGNRRRYGEAMLERHVFAAWWIARPTRMDETFIEKESYWHAWDAHRSISLTSLHLSDRRGRIVGVQEILDQIPPLDGEAITVPNALPGWAVIVGVPESPRADTAISGILVVEGNALIATVTSRDLDWARWIWQSIRHDPIGDAVRLSTGDRLRAALSGTRSRALDMR